MRERRKPARRTGQDLIAAHPQPVHEGVLSVLLPIDIRIAAETNRVVAAVIVERERAAPMAFADWRRKAVHGTVIGAENHASAPFWDYEFGRLFRRLLPKLQRATETLFPFRVT